MSSDFVRPSDVDGRVSVLNSKLRWCLCIGLYKPGGNSEATTEQLLDCIELASLRYEEVVELMEQALAADND
jgi:hypothetical protein